MRESELLRHIYARSAGLLAGAGDGGFEQVVVGPGDDCAVVRALGGGGLLLKVDQAVSGVHFRPPPATPIDLIARKAVARAVSDIAAMAGTPLCALAAAVLPPDAQWADELFDAMAKWARHWGCPLVGGDICMSEPGAQATGAAAQDPALALGALMLGVTIVGVPHTGRGPVLRSGARAGDGVYVTGPLGATLDAATGLGHHLTFEPRVAEAQALAGALGPRLHAMMDISDGLGLDASRLAAASGVRIELDASSLPLRGAADWRGAAADGEDYELLFTTDATDLPVTACRVGRVADGQGCAIKTPEGEWLDASAMGWGGSDEAPE